MTLAARKRVRGYNPKSKLGFLRDEFRALKQYLSGGVGVDLFLTHLHFRREGATPLKLNI